MCVCVLCGVFACVCTVWCVCMCACVLCSVSVCAYVCVCVHACMCACVHECVHVSICLPRPLLYWDHTRNFCEHSLADKGMGGYCTGNTSFTINTMLLTITEANKGVSLYEANEWFTQSGKGRAMHASMCSHLSFSFRVKWLSLSILTPAVWV